MSTEPALTLYQISFPSFDGGSDSCSFVSDNFPAAVASLGITSLHHYLMIFLRHEQRREKSTRPPFVSFLILIHRHYYQKCVVSFGLDSFSTATGMFVSFVSQLQSQVQNW
jgi:hypothetical protein